MQVSGRSVHLYIESGSSFHSLIWFHRFPRIWNCLGFSYFYPDMADDRREIKRRIRKHAPPSLLLSFHPSPSPSIRLRPEKNDGLSVWDQTRSPRLHVTGTPSLLAGACASAVRPHQRSDGGYRPPRAASVESNMRWSRKRVRKRQQQASAVETEVERRPW